MQYSHSSHAVFQHRYHIVWATKYRHKILQGDLRLRIRDIIKQTCGELGVSIIKGALSHDHVHMFVAIPPKLSESDVVRRIKGRSSHRIQREFAWVKKLYWGQRFWARGYFSTTSGNITNEVILQYLEAHIKPTDISR